MLIVLGKWVWWVQWWVPTVVRGAVIVTRATTPATAVDRRNNNAARRWNYGTHYTMRGSGTVDVARMTSAVPPTRGTGAAPTLVLNAPFATKAEPMIVIPVRAEGDRDAECGMRFFRRAVRLGVVKGRGGCRGS